MGAPVVVIYRGFIKEHDRGEAMDILYIGEPDEWWCIDSVNAPVAMMVQQELEAHGPYLSVRYAVAEHEFSADEMTHDIIMMSGLGEAKYLDFYTEITGYCFTDEDINVGGHDLLSELRSHLGKFVHLEITYSQEPTA